MGYHDNQPFNENMLRPCPVLDNPILGRLSGKRKVHKTIPLKMVHTIAPFCEKVERMIGGPILITPYSIYTLGSNGNFSHDKADRELGYSVHPIKETLADVVSWIQKGR